MQPIRPLIARWCGAYRAAAWVWALVLLAVHVRFLLGLEEGLGDTRDLHMPTFGLVGDVAREGALLLWNPWTNGGAPDGFEPQVGAMSPLYVAFAWLGAGRSLGFRLLWVCLWWLGGQGLLALGRRLGAPAWAALAVTLGFAFGGTLVTSMSHTTFVCSVAFLPWIVERMEHALERRSLRAAAESGALWGLSSLSGYPALSLLTGLFLGAWVLGRVLFARDASSARCPLARGVALLLVCVGLAALVVLPLVLGLVSETTAYTFRSLPLPRADAISNTALSRNALSPSTLVTFASPGLATLTLGRLEGWSAPDPGTIDLHQGALVPALMILALIAGRRCAWRWWLFGVGLFFFAAALTPLLPLRGWLYDLLPPTRFFRHSGVFRVFFLFAACALALEGAKDLAAALRTGSRVTLRTGVLVAAGWMFVAALAALDFVVRTDPPWRASWTLLFVWEWGGVLALAALALFAAARVTGRALALLVGLHALVAGVWSLQAVRSVVFSETEVWRRFDEDHDPRVDPGLAGWNRRLTDSRMPAEVNDMVAAGELARAIARMGAVGGGLVRNHNLALKEATLFGYTSMGNHYHNASALEPAAWGMATGTERTWFTPRALAIEATLDSYAEWLGRCGELGSAPLLVHRRDEVDLDPSGTLARRLDERELRELRSLPAAERLPAAVVEYERDALELELAIPEDGWLLVTERWASSWRATVDGRPVPLWVGNFLWRAVEVQAGPRRLRFEYRPFGWPWLLLLSWSSLGAVAALSAWTRIVERRVAARALRG